MEGPSLVIATEELAKFRKRNVEQVSGNAKIELSKLENQQLLAVRSWGKHLLLEFSDFFIRIHFLMYGSYRVDEQKDYAPRLSLKFPNGEANFYSCSVKLISDCKPAEVYDWRVDVMSPKWDSDYVYKKLTICEHEKVCDVLLDQNIFAGVGNIIKNEVLFNLRMDPNSLIDALDIEQLQALVTEAQTYSHKFYEWKKKYVLKKHWQIMRKKICPRDQIPIIKKKTGRLQRWSFYCTKCQHLYS